MSSTELEKHLVIDLRASKILLLSVSAISLLALIAVLLFPLGFQYKFLIVILINSNYIYFLYKYGWLMLPTIQKLIQIQQPIVQIRFIGENDWQLQSYSGELFTAKLMGSSYSGLNLVILKFKLNNVPWLIRRLSVVILKDAINPTSFRHLRIHLRLILNPI